MRRGKIFIAFGGLLMFAGLAIYGLKVYIHIGDPSRSGISDVHYLIVHDIARDALNKEFDRQVVGLDEKSKLRLKTIFNQIYGFGYYSEEEFARHAKIWENEEKPFYYRYIKRSEDVMDSLYFEHGLRFSSQKIKDYVADKDILNIGAETYNPANVMAKYTKGKIFCIGNKLTNNVPEDLQSKCIFIDANLSSQDKNIDLGKIVVNGVEKKLEHKLESLDSLFANKSTKIGFIRIRNYTYSRHESGDHLMNVLKGGLEIIKKNRPVLSISYCHSLESLLKLKPFLENNLPDYVFEIQRHGYKNESTAVLFCYPKELAE